MAEPWLIRFFACNREMQPFSFLFCYSLWGGGGDFGSGSGSKFNCAARVGSGRVGSDDLGYGPGSGFSFEPVQTSNRCAVSFTAHIHTEAHVTLAVTSASAVSLNEDINTWTTSPELLGVTSWAFDRFIWVKRSSYHIYIGYRNLKGPHGNLSKYKFGLAEYITVVQ